MDSPTPKRYRDTWSRVRAAWLRPHVFVALLVAATLVGRSSVLPAPIYGIRSTQSAMIANNLYRDLEEIGPKAIFYPRVDYAGEQPGHLLLEFPLFNLLGVALRSAFDLQPETAYRLASLLAFTAALPLLFAFVQRRFGTVEAVIATLLMSWYPVVVVQSVEVIPEQLVATAFLAGMWSFDRHLDEDRSLPLIAATICFASMLLIKSTNGLLLLGAVGLFQQRRGGLGGLFRVRYALAAGLGIVPLAAWMVHARPVNEASVLDDGMRVSELVSQYLEQNGRVEMLTSLGTWEGIASMMARAYGTTGLLLGAAGLLFGQVRGTRGRALLVYWFAAFALFVLVLPFNTSTHWYYTHGYAPLLALGTAVLLASSVRWCLARVPAESRRALGAALVLAGLAFVVDASWDYTVPHDSGKLRFARALQRVVPPRALGIVSSRDLGIWNGFFFYASDTRGWRRNFISDGEDRALLALAKAEASQPKRRAKLLELLNEKIARKGIDRRDLTEEFIEEKRRLGARFLAHYGSPDELQRLLPGLFGRILAEYRVVEQSPNWIVFSLEK